MRNEEDLKKRLSMRYRQKFGRIPNFDDPQSFQEKMGWKMLYDRNPLLTLTADKLRVYDYLREKRHDDILIPLLFSGEAPEQVPFHALPENYVVKTNHGSGGMVIVKGDKIRTKYGKFRDFDMNFIFNDINKRLKSVYNGGLEWCYNDIKPMVLVQEYIGGGDLPAYKFYVFSGKCDYLYCETGDGLVHKISLLDRNFKQVSVKYDKFSSCVELKKPSNFQEMHSLAESLGKDFDFVRVDLYNVDGQIYFGEFTHYPTAGLTKFTPDDFSFELGKDWKPNG